MNPMNKLIPKYNITFGRIGHYIRHVAHGLLILVCDTLIWWQAKINSCTYHLSLFFTVSPIVKCKNVSVEE